MAKQRNTCDVFAFAADISEAGDIDHLVCGPAMPAVTKSSSICTMTAQTILSTKGHWYSARELCFSQGWPVLCKGPDVYNSCMLMDADHYYSTVNVSAQSAMRGNGMHLFSIGNWLLHCWSPMIARKDVEQFDMYWLTADEETDSMLDDLG